MTRTRATTGWGPARPEAVLIAGPTASGKSGLALALARALGGAIINADSMQVYRELTLLTARPDRAAERAVPHRLYGTVGAGEPYSAGRWLAEAAAEIDRAREAGRLPVIVGGTGLYFASLLGGLSDIPEVPRQVREKWRAVERDEGAGALRRALEELDPDMAARIMPGDRQRTLRALEVIEATGRSLRRWREDAAPATVARDSALRIVAAPPRAELCRRIDERAGRMIEAGALDEVRVLLGLGLDPELPAMKAIGVRELGAVVRGEAGIEEALAAMRTATRRYAKRQLTWARGRMTDWWWVEDAGKAAEELTEGAGG